MKITSKPLGIVIVVVMFGGIFFSSAMNWWQTESTKVPARYTSGEAVGEYNPADIRGSYAFGEVSQLFGVPLDDLATAFGLPADLDAETFQAKDLETMYEGLETEIGTESLRLFVALYQGLPFTIDGDIYLPLAAVDILKQQAGLSESQVIYLDAHAVDVAALAEGQEVVAAEAQTALPETAVPETVEEVVSTPEPAVEHNESEDRMVKGKTTFREVLDWGVTQEQIESVIGAAMPNPLTTVKDYCTGQGIEFSTIKTALQEEIDRVQP